MNHSTPEYAIVDLGTLGGRDSDVRDMNESGVVVGYATTGNQRTGAFTWTQGHMVALPPGGALGSSANAVSASGSVAGTTYDLLGGIAVIWEKGKCIDLPLPPRGTIATAVGINSANDAVGGGNVAGDTAAHPYIWRRGKLQQLAVPKPWREAEPRRINDSGEIVGECRKDVVEGRYIRQVRHACKWIHGRFVDLLPDMHVDSSAYGIDARGGVVGERQLRPSYPMRAFLMSGSRTVDLGVLPGDASSTAHGLNAHGLVTGTSVRADLRTRRAFLWRNGKMIDLNTLIDAASGWTLQDAVAINSRGEIAGNGRIHGVYHGFLLRPMNLRAHETDADIKAAA